MPDEIEIDDYGFEYDDDPDDEDICGDCGANLQAGDDHEADCEYFDDEDDDFDDEDDED